MKWEAYYAQWDVIRDRRAFAAYCLIFDRIHIFGLSWGDFFPKDGIAAEKAHEMLYEETRLHEPTQRQGLEKWYADLRTGGFKITFDELVSVDEALFREYSVDWWPFYNYVTPLASGNDPILAQVIPQMEPGDLGLYNRGILPGSLQQLKEWSRRNRQLGIQFLMEKACHNSDGILVYDEPMMDMNHMRTVQLAELLAPFLAQRCASLTFPCCGDFSAEEILELRSKLKDQLLSFRNVMLEMSLDTAESLSEARPLDEVMQRVEARVKRVELSLSDLQNKITLEKSKLLSKLVSGLGGFTSMTSIVASLATQQWWLSVLGMGAQLIMTYSDHNKVLEQMKRESRLAYLFDLRARISK